MKESKNKALSETLDTLCIVNNKFNIENNIQVGCIETAYSTSITSIIAKRVLKKGDEVCILSCGDIIRFHHYRKEYNGHVVLVNEFKSDIVSLSYIDVYDVYNPKRSVSYFTIRCLLLKVIKDIGWIYNGLKILMLVSGKISKAYFKSNDKNLYDNVIRIGIMQRICAEPWDGKCCFISRTEERLLEFEQIKILYKLHNKNLDTVISLGLGRNCCQFFTDIKEESNPNKVISTRNDIKYFNELENIIENSNVPILALTSGIMNLIKKNIILYFLIFDTNYKIGWRKCTTVNKIYKILNIS
jgi:hypothetical protein